jgi:predicted SAM-dependent methyltransferase
VENNSNFNLFDSDKKIVLNLGAGNVALKEQTNYFNDWKEIRVDIKELNPDLVSDLTDLKEIPDQSIDAIWACHVIEHMYWHDLPKVLNSIVRVLKNDAFAIIRVPDLASIANLITNDILTPVYTTDGGIEITPLDMLYSYRGFFDSTNQNKEYNHAMLHKTGFTPKSILQICHALDIKAVAASKGYEIHCVIYKDVMPEFILDNSKIY